MLCGKNEGPIYSVGVLSTQNITQLLFPVSEKPKDRIYVQNLIYLICLIINL